MRRARLSVVGGRENPRLVSSKLTPGRQCIGTPSKVIRSYRGNSLRFSSRDRTFEKFYKEVDGNNIKPFGTYVGRADKEYCWLRQLIKKYKNIKHAERESLIGDERFLNAMGYKISETQEPLETVNQALSTLLSIKINEMTNKKTEAYWTTMREKYPQMETEGYEFDAERLRIAEYEKYTNNPKMYV
ncbi:hypothetical protein HYALB_00009437 [Hymenoscyphus albidus]|uniref:Uncharacterized protein n=1 Tax=Hymenoscyphus albidus TaxID=595503 RepID=A0A9N9Q6B5_9HELO|nr:hypothetical protein HYALB_00009437 [Hymenoscyphus albidus]